MRDLARLRRVCDVSGLELAERVGVSLARRLAQGGELTLSELAEVARALDVDVQVRLTPRSFPRATGDPRAVVGLLQAAMLRSHDPLERYAAGMYVTSGNMFERSQECPVSATDSRGYTASGDSIQFEFQASGASYTTEEDYERVQ
jgi:hypothetical protein